MKKRKKKNRFSVMEVENIEGPGVSAWIVFDAHEGAWVLDFRFQSEADARKFAAAKNAKEELRTAKILFNQTDEGRRKLMDVTDFDDVEYEWQQLAEFKLKLQSSVVPAE